jgi:hypothetical protein
MSHGGPNATRSGSVPITFANQLASRQVPVRIRDHRVARSALLFARVGIEQFRTECDVQPKVGPVVPARNSLDVTEIVHIACGSSMRSTMLSVR